MGGAGAGRSGEGGVRFHLRVVGFEIRVGDRPIHQAGTGYRADLAAFDEIDFMKTPEISGEVNACPADASSIHQGALWLGFLVRRFSKRVWLQLRLVGELVLRKDFTFVV